MPEWVRRWEERTRAADKRRRAVELEQERLGEEFPDTALSPDGVRVRLEPRYSGEPPDLDIDGYGIGVFVGVVWAGLAWVRFRDGWTVWITAEGYHRSKFRYSTQLAALGDGARLAGLVEERGTSAVGLRPKVRTARRMRRAAASPQDRKLTRGERRSSAHDDRSPGG